MREKSRQIRDFILSNVEAYPKNIAGVTATTFAISRQAVHRHITELIRTGDLTTAGNTRSKEYALRLENILIKTYPNEPTLSEDSVYREDTQPILRKLNVSEPVNQRIAYCFTEMFNNAIDHSEGTSITVRMDTNTSVIRLTIRDNGIGIFKKIKDAFNLEDERVSMLELSKGKLTTASDKHSGEGIFFTSRVADQFRIRSHQYSLVCVHDEDWVIESETRHEGTLIIMTFLRSSTRTTSEVFAKFQGVDFGFTITHVPVALARIGEENLISRSQAKRLLARLEKFEKILLDFSGVKLIGQAFADEIFRVFQNAHPNIVIQYSNANPEVTGMIKRALHLRQSEQRVSTT